MILKYLLIRDEYNKLSHEICEAYFQSFVNPCREIFLPKKQEQILFNEFMNAFVEVCIIQDELSRIEAKWKVRSWSWVPASLGCRRPSILPMPVTVSIWWIVPPASAA